MCLKKRLWLPENTAAFPIRKQSVHAMAEFDKHAEIYSKKIDNSIELFGQSHDFFVRNKASIIVDVLSEIGAPENMQVLDVGCGTGLVLGHLVDRIPQLYGVDVSHQSLAVAEQSNPSVRFKVFDGGRLPYEDGFFDCAFAICVIHHVPVNSWEFFVKEMARVTRPGGTIIVIEHNPLNPATNWVVRNCDLDENAVLLWPKKARQLFEAACLQEIVTQHIQFTPFEGSFFRRLDNWLSRIPLGTQYVMKARRGPVV
jgi:ubiquinone/menaquinone biosynthesis C-methylase UbiE